MVDKENKSVNIIKIDEKSGECACSLPKPGDFKQVITLKNSGLTIFLHRNVEVQKTSKKKNEETFILHNAGDKELNRPDYISEMCQYKTNCIKCKLLVQKVHSLIDEIKYIKMDEVIGVCEYCKHSNAASKCRRCEYIVSKYLSLKNKVYQNKQARFMSWLSKVNDLLRNILDEESVCMHRLYRDSHSALELKQLFSELRTPLTQRQPEITYFPTTAPDPFTSFSTLGQSKDMLEGILKRIKIGKSKHYTSEDSMLLSSSRSSTGCVCKYFMSKRMKGRHSMEVLPQDKYYPPGLITSREFARSLSSELRFRGSLDIERYGRRRSFSAEYYKKRYSDYSRDGTSKERGRRSVLDKISSEYISGRSQDSGRARDEYKRGRGSRRDEYGKERGSKRDEYGSDRRSNRDEYERERGSRRDEYERERESRRDEYERERGSKRDKYDKERGSNRDQYSKERGSKRDEYGKERGLKRDEYERERESKRDEYERERGSKRDKYDKERGSKRDQYSKERGSKRDEYGKERGSKRDEYGRERESKRDEYERERGLKRDEYSKEKGSKRDEYGKGKGSKTDRHGSARGSKKEEYGSEKGSKRDEYEREKAPKKEITTGAKDKLPGIVSQKSRVDEDISRKESGKSKEGKSKRESPKDDISKRDSTKKTREEITKKDIKLGDSIEVVSRGGKTKTDKSKEHDTDADIAKKGTQAKKKTSKEEDSKDKKKGKGKIDKKEDVAKKGTQSKKETSKEEDLNKEKKGKGKTDKEERSSKKLKEDIVITQKSPKKKIKEATVIIKDEEIRKRLKKKAPSKNLDKDKESEESVSDVDVITSKMTKGKKDKKSERKEKSTTVIPIKKKKASSEAVLLLKMMKEMRLKRQKEKEDKIEPIKHFASLDALPVIRRKLKSKVEPLFSESFIECNDYRAREVKKIIIGNKIYHFDPTHKTEERRDHQPLIFEIMQSFPDVVPPPVEAPPPPSPLPESKKRPSTGGSKLKSKSKMLEESAEGTAGVMKYQLSNRKYIEDGWTILPTTKILRKMNTYNMKLANPAFDFFKMNKKKKIMFYESGEKLAEIYSNENGKWFYKNGNLALHCYKPEEPNVRKRYIIYSSGAEKDNGTFLPITILGLFDQLGNAVIYDHFGNVRFKYNQSEGVIIDEKIGPPGRWKWHTLNDPPVLQPVFIDTFVQERDEDLEEVIRNEREAQSEPSRIIKDANVDMIMIEFENFVREKANKLLQKFKPFQIRMKAVKINDHFSIRVLDQASVTLIFKDKPNTLKLHLGMNLINSEIVDTETSEVSEVATPYDRIPARTQSVSNIQEALNRAKKYGKNMRNRMHSGPTVN